MGKSLILKGADFSSSGTLYVSSLNQFTITNYYDSSKQYSWILGAVGEPENANAYNIDGMKATVSLVPKFKSSYTIQLRKTKDSYLSIYAYTGNLDASMFYESSPDKLRAFLSRSRKILYANVNDEDTYTIECSAGESLLIGPKNPMRLIFNGTDKGNILQDIA